MNKAWSWKLLIAEIFWRWFRIEKGARCTSESHKSGEFSSKQYTDCELCTIYTLCIEISSLRTYFCNGTRIRDRLRAGIYTRQNWGIWTFPRSPIRKVWITRKQGRHTTPRPKFGETNRTGTSQTCGLLGVSSTKCLLWNRHLAAKTWTNFSNESARASFQGSQNTTRTTSGTWCS